jgi:hypothetical protein
MFICLYVVESTSSFESYNAGAIINSLGDTGCMLLISTILAVYLTRKSY